MSRVSDDDWESYRRYDQMNKELRRLKAMPLVDVDDMNVASGAQGHVQRQSVGVSNEGAGADPQPLLGFNAWCKRRSRHERRENR